MRVSIVCHCPRYVHAAMDSQLLCESGAPSATAAQAAASAGTLTAAFSTHCSFCSTPALKSATKFAWLLLVTLYWLIWMV